jgi:glycerate kinase
MSHQLISCKKPFQATTWHAKFNKPMIVIAVHIWGSYLKNKKIVFNTNNQAVVAIINKKSSKSERVLTTLTRNIMIKSEYIQGKLKVIADSLSRGDWQRFRRLCPTADQQPASSTPALFCIKMS